MTFWTPYVEIVTRSWEMIQLIATSVFTTPLTNSILLCSKFSWHKDENSLVELRPRANLAPDRNQYLDQYSFPPTHSPTWATLEGVSLKSSNFHNFGHFWDDFECFYAFYNDFYGFSRLFCRNFKKKYENWSFQWYIFYPLILEWAPNSYWSRPLKIDQPDLPYDILALGIIIARHLRLRC